MSEEIPKKLDAYHWHEALDRSSICMELLDKLILFHPVIEQHEDLKSKAEKAHQLLFELYQRLGSLILEKEEDK